MQKVRELADEPAPPADPQAEPGVLMRPHHATTAMPTSKRQAALDTAER